MNKLKYIIVIFFSAVLSSCFDEAVNIAEEIQATDNVLGFVDRNANVSGIADGTEYTFYFPVQVVGPSSDQLTGTYTANVSVDASSTAVEGKHYRLEETVISASEEQGYLSQFKVVMLTEGIETPLAENPVLVLNVSDAGGPGNVMASGAKLKLNMLYLCPSDLSGDYAVTIVSEGSTYNYTETITEVGVGEYRGQSVGHWAPGAIGGEPGFNFTDVCGTITVPQQNLVNLYSNLVSQGGNSYVHPETGDIHIEYVIPYGPYPDGRKYVADYVKQ